MYIYIYIYIHIHKCVSIYVHIYIHICICVHKEVEGTLRRSERGWQSPSGSGQEWLRWLLRVSPAWG